MPRCSAPGCSATTAARRVISYAVVNHIANAFRVPAVTSASVGVSEANRTPGGGYLAAVVLILSNTGLLLRQHRRAVHGVRRLTA